MAQAEVVAPQVETSEPVQVVEPKVEEVVETKEQDAPKKSKRPNRGTSKRTRTKKTSEEKVEE